VRRGRAEMRLQKEYGQDAKIFLGHVNKLGYFSVSKGMSLRSYFNFLFL
jgi:hypothetical protein